jgi:2,3-bisphosphoglycerate-independent phosphoglycerate mutase
MALRPAVVPGHLGIFGYDPLEYQIGRGILEALGLGIEVKDTDIAIRGNYATVEYVDGKPIVKDRRAGRIATEENRRITQRIKENIKEIDGVEVIIEPGNGAQVCAGAKVSASVARRFRPNKGHRPPKGGKGALKTHSH